MKKIVNWWFAERFIFPNGMWVFLGWLTFGRLLDGMVWVCVFALMALLTAIFGGIRTMEDEVGSEMIKTAKQHVTGQGACMLNKCNSRLRKSRKRIGQKKARRALAKDM